MREKQQCVFHSYTMTLNTKDFVCISKCSTIFAAFLILFKVSHCFPNVILHTHKIWLCATEIRLILWQWYDWLGQCAYFIYSKHRAINCWLIQGEYQWYGISNAYSTFASSSSTCLSSANCTDLVDLTLLALLLDLVGLPASKIKITYQYSTLQ